MTRLTSAPGEEEEPEFSPDGRLLAFVRAGNLYATDLEGHERALTTDGTAEILNGKLDWVYQEEVYGRGTFRSFWWSPDSSRLAFLQLNEHPVPIFPLVDHIPGPQVIEDTRYPRAGDPNPLVRLGVVRAAGSDVQWVDDSKYTAAEHLIVDVDWTPDSRQVVYQVQDREQTWLDLGLGNAASGATKTLLRETTKAWVSRIGPAVWLEDGSFLWLSERSGFQHIYHYAADGGLIAQVTSGKWEADTLYGVDEAAGWIYFLGTEHDPIGRDLYRVKIDGTGFTRLSRTEGTHSAAFNPSCSLYVDTWSDVATPPQVRLHKADGTEVRTIDRNEVPALRNFKLSTPEFVHVTTHDGFVLEAEMIKPPDFDASKKYPVFSTPTSGPHAPQVRNAWGGTSGLYYQLLAERGLVVWICDNRSASGKGAESAWVAYQRLGETELADLEECLGYLKARAVDRREPDRPGRLELRRLHDELRADAQHGLVDGDCRRLGDRLAQLRLDLHRALHAAAAEQPGRIRAHGAEERRQVAARPSVPDPRHDGRQRAHGQHDPVRLRARAGGQAVRADALPEVSPRRHGSAAGEAPARTDARLHAADAQARSTGGRHTVRAARVTRNVAR